MKTRPTMYRTLISGVFLLLIFISTKTQAQIFVPFLFPNLEVNSLTITKQEGDAFSFTYKIKNVGNGTLFLSHYFFQAWVSKDATLSADDLPAGGSNFGENAPNLTPGQTYSKSWNSDPNGSIEEYRFLIFDVKLRSGFSDIELGTDNNRLAKDMRPGFPDLVVVKPLSIVSIDGNNKIKFKYIITNSGHSDLNLYKFVFDTYVSANSTLETGTDIFAGTSEFDAGGIFFPNSVLSRGDTIIGTYTANPGANVDLNIYDNLLFNVRLKPGEAEPQKSRSNDKASILLVPNFADLEIDRINIKSINETNVTFEYRITNKGTNKLYLDRFLLQTYVSANQTLETNIDVTAGNGSIVSTPIVLAPNATHQGTFVCTLSVNLKNYPYLICDVKLLPGKVHPQKITTNDRAFRNFGKIGPKIHLWEPHASYSGMNVQTSFYVLNGGNQNLNLSNFHYEIYLSKSFSLQGDYILLTDTSFADTTLLPEQKMLINLNLAAPVNPNDYRYVLYYAWPKPGVITDDPGSETFTQGTSAPDLILNTISVGQYTGSTVTAEFQVVNWGNSDLPLGKFNYLVYLSKDHYINEGDIFVSERSFPSLVIQPYSNTIIDFNFTSFVNPGIYNYLIVKAILKPNQTQEEFWTDNNWTVMNLEAEPLSLRTSVFTVAQQEESLQISNTSDDSQLCEYVLYSMQGAAISQGSFNKDLEIITRGLNAGMYILNINNGGNIESHKIIIQ